MEAIHYSIKTGKSIGSGLYAVQEVICTQSRRLPMGFVDRKLASYDTVKVTCKKCRAKIDKYPSYYYTFAAKS